MVELDYNTATFELWMATDTGRLLSLVVFGKDQENSSKKNLTLLFEWPGRSNMKRKYRPMKGISTHNKRITKRLVLEHLKKYIWYYRIVSLKWIENQIILLQSVTIDLKEINVNLQGEKIGGNRVLVNNEILELVKLLRLNLIDNKVE